jgi:hypothetical protein
LYFLSPTAPLGQHPLSATSVAIPLCEFCSKTTSVVNHLLSQTFLQKCYHLCPH